MTFTLPDWLYKTTWIYHITAIENLPSILQHGKLHCTNQLPCKHTTIANSSVQRHREVKAVTVPPHGVIHDYVPFYFAPRSPMLSSNHNRNFADAKPQAEIVHLVTSAQAIDAARLPYVFYDHHAVKAFAQPYNSLEHLNKIDWELFFEDPLVGGYSKWWHSVNDATNPKRIKRMEVRMAEFLVYQSLAWGYIQAIAVQTAEKATSVQNILNTYNVSTPVIIKPDWYY